MTSVKKDSHILDPKDESMDVEDYGDANLRSSHISEVVEVGQSRLRSATHKFDDDVKYIGKKINRFEFQKQEVDDSTITTSLKDHLDLDFEDNESESMHSGTDIDDDSSLDDCNENELDENVNKEEKLEDNKGILAQFELYDELLDCRIWQQEMLMETNKLPHPNYYKTSLASLGEDYQLQLFKTKRKMKLLLKELLLLQEEMLSDKVKKDKTILNEVIDEEITSEEDDESNDKINERLNCGENDDRYTNKQNDDKSSNFVKQIINSDAVLKDRHQAYQSIRNNILLESFDRVNSFASLSNNKNSTATNSSILTQIKQILTDKQRLIDRTRVKRSDYKIIGIDSDEEVLEKDDKSKIKVTNCEIFDDDDFYHQLLVEMTKRKTSNLKDMMAISRHWSKIGHIKKLKKNIDQKASKGRRMRYSVHKKLVNFMAPVPLNNNHWSNNQKDGMFTQLFKTENKSQNIVNWMFQ